MRVRFQLVTSSMVTTDVRLLSVLGLEALFLAPCPDPPFAWNFRCDDAVASPAGY